MPTYRLDLAYDGTGFHGLARQPGQRTVQGVLDEALEKIVKGATDGLAGRTDAGVHARHQVVTFSTEAPSTVGSWRDHSPTWLVQRWLSIDANRWKALSRLASALPIVCTGTAYSIDRSRIRCDALWLGTCVILSISPQ